MDDKQTDSRFFSSYQFNGRILFNWNIHWVCNYRCPYCWHYGKWAILKGQCDYIRLEELMKFWEDIYLAYDKVKIVITGGEPFIYPNFVQLIKELSQFHKIQILTNLSEGIDTLINNKIAFLKNIEIVPSFHPLFADFDSFVRGVLGLKEKGLTKEVLYLAWPPQINFFEFYRKKFLKYRISISAQPFFGECRGIRYPEGYTDEEKKAILPYFRSLDREPLQTKSINTKGKACAAGHRYAVIFPSGKILRCRGRDSSRKDRLIIGNLLDEDFELLKEPSLCISQTCYFNEWRFLLEG